MLRNKRYWYDYDGDFIPRGPFQFLFKAGLPAQYFQY